MVKLKDNFHSVRQASPNSKMLHEEELFTTSQCAYCQEEISSLGVECLECHNGNFRLCVECFSLGAEIGQHKADHKYRFFEGSTQLLADNNSTGCAVGTTTPVTDTSTVITEDMANQALKSLVKVPRKSRTISTSAKVEDVVEEEPTPTVCVDRWPKRKFPLTDEEYKEMLDVMKSGSKEED